MDEARFYNMRTHSFRVSHEDPAEQKSEYFNETADRLTMISIWMMMGAGLISEVLGGTQIVSLGFYTLHSVDPAITFSVMAVFACIFRGKPRYTFPFFLALIISILMAANLFKGLIENLPSALLWARAHFATVSLILLAATCSPSARIQNSFRMATLYCGLFISFLCFLRVAIGVDLFMLNKAASVDLINDGGRPLTSAGAFIISLAAAIALSDAIKPKQTRRLKSLVLFAVLFVGEVLSGQGTATLCLLAMVFIVFSLQYGKGFLGRLSLGLFFAAFSVLAIFFSSDMDISSMTLGPFDLARRANNLGTREIVWSSFRSAFNNLDTYQQFFGISAGRDLGMAVYLNGQISIWQAELHNGYYGVLKNVGYVGAFMMLFLVVAVSVGLIRNMIVTRGYYSIPAYPFAMVMGTAILAFSYELHNYTVIGLFIAIWWYRFPGARQVVN